MYDQVTLQDILKNEEETQKVHSANETKAG